MFKPQSSLLNYVKYKNHPFKMQKGGSSWGKVVAQNADGSVDVCMQNGGTYKHVQVESPVLGSQVGQFYNPTNDLTNPINDPGGIWDTPVASGKRDLFCEVGFLENSTRQPVVRGFFLPGQNMMAMPVGTKVDLHESGAYRITTADPTDQFVWPDGSYLSVGSTTAVDMTQLNPNWNPPTVEAPLPVVLHHASGVNIEISPAGVISLTGSVAVGAGGHPVALADLLIAYLASHTHTAPSGGGPTSAPIQTPPSDIAATALTTS